MSSKKSGSSVTKQSHLHYLVKTKNYLSLEKCLRRYLYPVKDEAGFTPFYYAVIQQDPVALKIFRRHNRHKWGKQDLLNAVIHHDMKGLQLLIKEGVKVDACNKNGQSALDLAFLHQNEEAIKLLRKHGATCLSKPAPISKQDSSVINKELPESTFKINIHGMQSGTFIELTQQDFDGRVSQQRFNPWESDFENSAKTPWKIFRQKESCFIYVPDEKNHSQAAALYEVTRQGNLTVHLVNQSKTSLSIHSNRSCSVKSLAIVNDLQVLATHFETRQESKLIARNKLALSVQSACAEGSVSAKNSQLSAQDTLSLKGTFETETLDIGANTVEQDGKIVVTNHYKVEAKADFNHQGEWISGAQGKILAQQVILAPKSLILSKEGEVNIYAKLKLENSGSVVAKHVYLGSGLILNHYYGALLKGETCLLNAPQVNTSGYVLQGQKNSLNPLDWLLNIAHAGVNLVELAALAPLPMMYKLRTAVVVSKSVVRAGELLYKLSTGRAHEISQSEIVSFLLDNVVPSLGAISCQKEKAQLLVNILYHLYGSFLSEAEVLDRSLSLIEGISRLAAFCITDTPWLNEAAKIIKYARYTCKVAELSGHAFSMWQNTDPKSSQQSMQHMKALAEGVFREFLYALPPIELLNANFQIQPRDLALFIMNNGHHSEMLLRSILYGALNLAKKQGLFDKGGYAEIELCLQIYLKSKSWQNLYYAYQNKEMSMNTLIQEALHGLMSLLNYQAQKNPLKKEVDEKKEETNSDVLSQHQETIVKPIQEAEIEAEKEEPEPEAKKQEEPVPEVVTPAHQITPEEIQAVKDQDLEKHQVEVPEYEKKVLTQDVTTLIEEHLLNQTPIAKEINPFKLACDTLLEVTRALNGDYTANSHFAAFAEAFHNEGVIDFSGDISLYVGHSASNNNALRNGKQMGIYGSNLARSFFQNLESGTMSAQEAIYISCLQIVENKGQIFSHGLIKANAVRIIKNYQQGQIIAKEDVALLAEVLSDNAGLISGKNVDFGGKDKVHNKGIVFAENNLKLMSQKLVELIKDGVFVAKKIKFETEELIKNGSIQAALVETAGSEQSSPDKISWHKGETDNILGLTLQVNKDLDLDKEALNSVQWTDLTLPETSLESKASLLEIDPTFNNNLQLHLPNLKETIPFEKLPNLSKEATLILEAPLSTLKVNTKSTYPNTLRFIGKEFDYSNQEASFENALLLDVNDISAKNAHSTLTLKQGGFLQAALFQNNGFVHSDDVLTLNLKALNSEAQLENYNQNFQYSLRLPVITTFNASKVALNSGKIDALGLQGYIGELNLQGGQLLSGKQGSSLFVKKANLEAILTWQGVNPTGILHEGGKNWYAKPIWMNAKMGSEGKNILIAKWVTAKGVDFWGDEDAYINTEEEDIELEVKSQSYEISQIESWNRKDKVDKVVQPYVMGNLKTSNNISADNGRVSLVAQNANVLLKNTRISAQAGAHLLAREKVRIEGVAEDKLESIHYRSSRLFRESSFRSVVKDTIVHSSYLFTGGDLVVRAEHFDLGAVNGVIGGNADIVAAKTTLQGKTQTHDETIVACDFKIEASGINNVSKLFNGHNAKAIFSSFMSACGWNHAELEALLHTKNPAELPKPLLHAARNAWNLTSFVAHACNEYGSSPEEFVAAFTDKMGLTRLFEANGEKYRVFNPEFNFSFKKISEETHTQNVIPTTFYVGGTFRLIGEELQLLGGATVDANQLSIFLTEGIKAVKGMDTSVHKEKTKKVDFLVNVTDLADFKVGIARESAEDEVVNYHLNELHARDIAVIHCQNEIVGNLKISSAKGGEVAAPRIQLTSVQNKASHHQITKSLKIGGSSFEGNYKNDVSLRTTTDKAGIDLPNGKIATDSLSLNGGAKIKTAQLARFDGQEGLPQVTGTEMIDLEKETHQAFSLQLNKHEPQGDIEKKYHDKATLNRPTVLADNVTAEMLPGINTLAAKESEVIKDKKGGYALAVFKPDVGKIAKEAEEIKKSARKGLHWLKQLKLPQKIKSLSNKDPKDLLRVPTFTENDALEALLPLPLPLRREEEKKQTEKPTKITEEPPIGQNELLNLDEYFAEDLERFREAQLSPYSDDYLGWGDLSQNDAKAPTAPSTPSAFSRIAKGMAEQRAEVNAGLAAVRQIHPILHVVVPASPEQLAIEMALGGTGVKVGSSVMQWGYKNFKAAKAANSAQKGGKYAGEFLQMQKRAGAQLKKSAASHGKQVKLHENKIKNPREKIKDWDNKSVQERNSLIRKWKEDAHRNRVYEKLAKRESERRKKGVM